MRNLVRGENGQAFNLDRTQVAVKFHLRRPGEKMMSLPPLMPIKLEMSAAVLTT